jgi:ABC-type dipeptide/oligopeptide/nickel transport system ATPase subunit
MVPMSDRSDDTGPTPEVSGSDDAAAPPPPADDAAPVDPKPAGSDLPPTAPTATATPRTEPPAPLRDAAARDIAAAPADPTRALPGEGADATQALPDTTRAAPLGEGRPGGDAAPAAPNGHTADFDHPNGRPFLHARGLTAAGRQGPVFTDVSVTASLGQVVAVCGDGGDGRSSLLLALTGRFALRSGTLEADGQTRPGQIRRRFTVAQAGPPIRLDPYHTVASCIKETVAVSQGAATRANIDAWLDRLAVGVDTGDTFGFLPRIDQIRFAVACAAACRTPAVAVDDTDSGLDTSGSERVFEALRTVADAGQLVIAACTRSDPPADTVIDLRVQHETAVPGHRRGDHATPRRRHGGDRNGGHQ